MKDVKVQVGLSALTLLLMNMQYEKNVYYMLILLVLKQTIYFCVGNVHVVTVMGN